MQSIRNGGVYFKISNFQFKDGDRNESEERHATLRVVGQGSRFFSLSSASRVTRIDKSRGDLREWPASSRALFRPGEVEQGRSGGILVGRHRSCSRLIRAAINRSERVGPSASIQQRERERERENKERIFVAISGRMKPERGGFSQRTAAWPVTRNRISIDHCKNFNGRAVSKAVYTRSYFCGAQFRARSRL